MYETMNCPIPDVAGYLRRIGIERAPGANLEGLNALILAHQTHVPFEDLNTAYLKRPVSLEIPALYDKIVVRRRGGYCFELNALFTRLLVDLGFEAWPVFCRVVRGRDFLPPCAHEGVVVRLGTGLFFCDVGFGGPMPASALAVEDGFEADAAGEYFRIDRFDERWWTLSRRTSGGEREAILQFNTFPQTPQEFLAVNQLWSTDPGSVFTRQLMVNLRAPEGSLSISGRTFAVRRGGEVHTEELPDDDALRRVLSENFDIRLPEEASGGKLS